ncbi:MAG: hypothetical protein P1U90_01945, partial [Akkermansiaceae bacterium]|nr:hypothetical protein [Akkermansiaceae bacterium]
GLLNRFEGEVAAGMDAHQAEEMVIEELDQLGRSIMGQWADTTHEKTLLIGIRFFKEFLSERRS